jgi:hypothetical protein
MGERRQATTHTAAADRKRLAADAARLVAGEQKKEMDCPTEVSHQKKA